MKEMKKTFKVFFVITEFIHWGSKLIQETLCSPVACHFKQVLLSRSTIIWVISLAPYSLTQVWKEIFLQVPTPRWNPGVPQNFPATSICISEPWVLWGGADLLFSAVYFFFVLSTAGHTLKWVGFSRNLQKIPIRLPCIFNPKFLKSLLKRWKRQKQKSKK